MDVESLNPSGGQPACHICGKVSTDAELERVRIVPLCQGGDTGEGNLITVCSTCNAQEFRDALWASLKQPHDFFSYFLTSIERVEQLLANPPVNYSLRLAFTNMLYVAVITAFETYLSDVLIGFVSMYPMLMRRLVETAPEFRARKFELREIYSRFEGIDEEARNYLLDLTYHNVAKVRQLYAAVLEVDFPDLTQIGQAVQRRHDIVHRGGKTRTGEVRHASSEEIVALAKTVAAFVAGIDRQITTLRYRLASA